MQFDICKRRTVKSVLFKENVRYPVMGVRRGGETGICHSLEIGTTKQKFLENVKSAFNSDYLGKFCK